MGNYPLHNFNPCSDSIQAEITLSKKIIQNKALSTKKNRKLQTQLNSNNLTLRPPQLQKTPSKFLQRHEGFSTDEQSSVSQEQYKISQNKHNEPVISPQSLIHQNTKQPTFQKIIKKIFIFDWDDTLFFSSHLRKCKLPIKKSEVIKQNLRQEIDQNVNFILKNCLQKGDVYIVTNSKEGWVKYSSENFLPNTSKTIFDTNKIKVISTRPSDEEFYLCTAPSKWKYSAFKEIIEQAAPKPGQQGFTEKIDLHLICIGDSEEQIDATNQIQKRFGKDYRNLYTKTIKLQDFPTVQDLLEEQQLLRQQLQMIVKADKILVIKLKRSPQKKTSRRQQ